MPELPEVQALVDFLGERTAGLAVTKVELASISVLKTFNPPPQALEGAPIDGVYRHGKFLDLDCDGTHLVFHLARAGWLRWSDQVPATVLRPGKSPIALRVRLSDGSGFDLTEAGTKKSLAAYIVKDPSEVPGIAKVAVPQWRVSFGPIDPAVRVNPYWARFFQIGTMSVALRRYGERAYGLLNCDIDELVGTRSGTSIYDLAKRSRGGLVAFRGTWIEATHEGTRHRDYTRRLADPKAAQSRQRKWALDSSRGWVRNLGVHPYWHWIHRRPPFSKTMPADATYWHFKPISTNWKVKRTVAPSGETIEDAALAAAFARLPE